MKEKILYQESRVIALFLLLTTIFFFKKKKNSCADVTIKGKNGGQLPKKTIQIYDFKGYKQDVTFDGDGNSHSSGPGPIESEKEANTR